MPLISGLLVSLYRGWYGRLHLKGAGCLLSRVARLLPGLQAFPVSIPGLATIEVDFRDNAAFEWQNRLLGRKCSEHGLLLAMSRYCRPGAVLWDVGANIGTISAHFAAPGHGLRAIHAFEPNPHLLATLRCLFAGKPMVQVHGVALSSARGQKRLHVPQGRSPLGSVVRQTAQGKGRTFTIDCYTGDEMVAEMRVAPPSLVKIDVEGHEIEVLKGMSGIIAAYRPVIFLEHLFLAIGELPLFENHSLVTVDSNDGSLYRGFHPERGHNIALIPAVPKLPGASGVTATTPIQVKGGCPTETT